jgi:hypothetical protein
MARSPRVIHKEGLCPSSGDMNRLLMMMMKQVTAYLPPVAFVFERELVELGQQVPARGVLVHVLAVVQHGGDEAAVAAHLPQPQQQH